MSRRQPADEDLLFDLPLERAPAAPTAPGKKIEQPGLPLAERQDPDGAETVRLDSPDALPPVDDRPLGGRRTAGKAAAVTLARRAAGGLIDLGVCAAVLVVMLVALLAQGVRPLFSDWPAGILFLLSFSFLYAVLPLAFWGRTPGMALAGLRTASLDGRPLTFRQAALKWLGSVLTVALGGLPLLLALGGRSLCDLISGSTTRLVERPA